MPTPAIVWHRRMSLCFTRFLVHWLDHRVPLDATLYFNLWSLLDLISPTFSTCAFQTLINLLQKHHLPFCLYFPSLPPQILLEAYTRLKYYPFNKKTQLNLPATYRSSNVMSSVDWASVDANNVSLPTIVTSTDLFDGELFGDELLDIYNSTVDDGSDHNGKSCSNAKYH
jgi:hypothetical protein